MRRRQLKTLVEIHSQQEGLGGNLTDDEIMVMQVKGSRQHASVCSVRGHLPPQEIACPSHEAITHAGCAGHVPQDRRGSHDAAEQGVHAQQRGSAG